MHRHFLSVCVGSLLVWGAQAAPIGPIPLWTAQPPGEAGTIGTEHDTTTAKDDLVAGKRVMRITDVTAPTLTVYRPPKSKQNGAAVLVFPGGGYRILAWDLEGTEICEWLNSIGVTGVLVKYRVPAQEARRGAPLLDAQRAIGMVRARAQEWGIDPKRVGMLGFSAGAYLSALASNNFEKRGYERVDAADDISCRPDFAVLVYPGGLTERKSDKLAPEFSSISAGGPPQFIVQTEDDGVRVENSLAYYAALKAAKIPVEMHLYPSGGHGYGLRASKHLVTSWPKRVQEWMQSLGMLGGPGRATRGGS